MVFELTREVSIAKHLHHLQRLEHRWHRVIIYDSVAGGAGLVAQLENEKLLQRNLESALNRVSGSCGCDEETSCYGCLRGYRNQFAHPNLRRGQAKKYLEALLSNWV